MSARIYLVECVYTNRRRLIRAANRAQATRFVANSQFITGVASQEDIVRNIQGGVHVEDAWEQVDDELTVVEADS